MDKVYPRGVQSSAWLIRILLRQVNADSPMLLTVLEHGMNHDGAAAVIKQKLFNFTRWPPVVHIQALNIDWALLS